MLSWDHKYDVGIERIDAQHHIFLRLVGEFKNARLAGESMAFEAQWNGKPG